MEPFHRERTKTAKNLVFSQNRKDSTPDIWCSQLTSVTIEVVQIPFY